MSSDSATIHTNTAIAEQEPLLHVIIDSTKKCKFCNTFIREMMIIDSTSSSAVQRTRSQIKTFNEQQKQKFDNHRKITRPNHCSALVKKQAVEK